MIDLGIRVRAQGLGWGKVRGRAPMAARVHRYAQAPSSAKTPTWRGASIHTILYPSSFSTLVPVPPSVVYTYCRHTRRPCRHRLRYPRQCPSYHPRQCPSYHPRVSLFLIRVPNVTLYALAVTIAVEPPPAATSTTCSPSRSAPVLPEGLCQ